MTNTTDIDRCPHCHADLTGDPIEPGELRDFYGASHYSRKLTLYDRDKDRTVAYECPDCGKRWER